MANIMRTLAVWIEVQEDVCGRIVLDACNILIKQKKTSAMQKYSEYCRWSYKQTTLSPKWLLFVYILDFYRGFE